MDEVVDVALGGSVWAQTVRLRKMRDNFVPLNMLNDNMCDFHGCNW